MQTLIFFSLFFSLNFSLNNALGGSKPPSHELRTSIDPASIFIKETTAVILQAEVLDTQGKLVPAKTITLTRLNDDGSVREDMGTLYDFGRMGDLLPDDGRFARKLQISEKKPMKIRFRIHAELKNPNATQQIEKDIELEVLGRPSFVEVLKKLARKAFN